MLGVSHVAVGAERKVLLDSGQTDHLENVIGVDGVEQPARKKLISTTFIDDTQEGLKEAYFYQEILMQHKLQASNCSINSHL